MRRPEIILTFSFMLLCLELLAQTEQQLLPAERKLQTLVTQPVTLYKGFLRVGLSGEFINQGSRFNGEGDRRALAFNITSATWLIRPKIEYGISDRIQAALIIPIVHQEGSGSLLEEIPGLGTRELKYEASRKGLQDVEVETAVQLLVENSKRPAITLFVNLSLPTGEKNPIDGGSPFTIVQPTGQGHFTLRSTLNARKVSYPFLYSARINYAYGFEGTKAFELNEPEISFRNAAAIQAGVTFGFHANEWMAIINDINYFTNVGDLMRDNESFEVRDSYRLDYSPTLTFQIRQLRINQVINFPIMGRNTTADPRFQIVIEHVF